MELVREKLEEEDEFEELNGEIYDALRTVFDYSSDKLSFDEVYRFVNDKTDRDTTWKALKDLSNTSYLSSELDYEEPEFLYWKG